MKYMRRTAGYIWADYKTNAQIAKELKITPILDKLLEYKRNCIQRVNRMPRSRLPRVMKRYCPSGRRSHGRPLKGLLDTWDRNGSTSCTTPWQIYDHDDDRTWYNMIYDMTWYNMIYDMTWYMIWQYNMIYDMTWYNMLYDMIQYDIWYDMIYYDIWHDMI